MTTLISNDIDLGYESFGNETNETILLISGLGTQMLRWTASFCEALVERGYRVIRFDNRDAGCSTHFADHPTPDFGALAAMLANGQRPVIPIRSRTWKATPSVCLMPFRSRRRIGLAGR
ncbi:alpha/beta fold hydrolase [Burkholderia ubonensis]|uniref:alpha/beta fold hydrolase n=1 Tax=Burkholderia ubonensis TaxID=101571 RepID=UPI000A4BD0F3|nr:alpha/beta hydrolase [Burkholderia ubonensis]MDY7788620.1 alpha/beta hydrolase [Burkholderia ubonensis]